MPLRANCGIVGCVLGNGLVSRVKIYAFHKQTEKSRLKKTRMCFKYYGLKLRSCIWAEKMCLKRNESILSISGEGSFVQPVQGFFL